MGLPLYVEFDNESLLFVAVSIMSVGEAWSQDPDLGNRDPNALNDFLKVSFEETIGEPDHTHSLDCVWKYSYKCFNLWKTLCYLILSTLCGIPIAMCWGCYFACIAFQHIWEITPCIRAWEINLSVFKRCYGMIVHACMDPCCEACGNLFVAFKK